MLNIGIVGAENSHTAAIAKVLNVEKRVRGVRVTHVWGETKAFAEQAAASGEIPHIVKNPEDFIGQVDAACASFSEYARSEQTLNVSPAGAASTSFRYAAVTSRTSEKSRLTSRLPSEMRGALRA